MRPLFSRPCTSFSQPLLSRRGAERSLPSRGKERRQPLRLQVGTGALAAAAALGRNGSAAVVRRPPPLHSYWNGASRCHILKFLNFRMWLKLKIKQQFSHNFKIFSTFIFLHREFSVKENKYWLFFKLNDVVLLVMHSCHMHSVVECENLSKRVLSSKILPGNFPEFSGFFSHFP